MKYWGRRQKQRPRSSNRWIFIHFTYTSRQRCRRLKTDECTRQIERKKLHKRFFLKKELTRERTSRHWNRIIVFTTRRYDSAVSAVVACLSLCPSVTRRYCIETTGQSSWVLARRLPSAYISHRVTRKYGVSPIIRVLPSETLSQTPYLEYFATASRSRRQHKKLSYRRGTARCVVSIEILPIDTQQCRNYLYDKSWPNRWYEVGDLVGSNAW